MPKYTVLRHTHYCDSAEVEAATPEEALRLAKLLDTQGDIGSSPFPVEGGSETDYEVLDPITKAFHGG